jgi:hypothetical protein
MFRGAADTFRRAMTVASSAADRPPGYPLRLQ